MSLKTKIKNAFRKLKRKNPRKRTEKKTATVSLPGAKRAAPRRRARVTVKRKTER